MLKYVVITTPRPRLRGKGEMMAVHNKQELQEMFESLGLGTEQDREHFLQLSKDFDDPTEKPDASYTTDFSNKSKPIAAQIKVEDA